MNIFGTEETEGHVDGVGSGFVGLNHQYPRKRETLVVPTDQLGLILMQKTFKMHYGRLVFVLLSVVLARRRTIERDTHLRMRQS